jgi:hypothetical protein
VIELLLSAAVLIGPAALIAFGAWLVHRGLKRTDGWVSRSTTVGIVVLLASCIPLAVLSSRGGLGPPLAFYPLAWAAVTAAIAGLLLLWSLPGRKKAAGLFLVVVLPALLLAAIFSGESRSPESITERKGMVIVDALQAYHRDNGYYPASLDELQPEYLNIVPDEPPFIWGWLYTVKNGTFYLGYVAGVDSLGYSVTLISSDSLEWDYMPLSTGPFVLGPTPAP